MIKLQLLMLTVLTTQTALAEQAPASAHFMGSPDRCKKKPDQWWFIDDAHPLDKTDTKREAYPFIYDKIGKLTPQGFMQTTVDFVLTFYDLCGIGTGKWQDIIGTELCTRLAAYDIAHERVLFEYPDQAKLETPSLFSPSELAFLRTVYKSCRPTTYRWPDFARTILHVSFNPTDEESNFFQKELGLTR